jgi:hypothetical protein
MIFDGDLETGQNIVRAFDTGPHIWPGKAKTISVMHNVAKLSVGR